ncbi:MAG: twin-arginine translocation signal domain-containing protein, partial [Arenibacter sp.]
MNQRRNFIKKTAITGAGIALLPNLSLGKGLIKDTQKLRVGVIGVGLRGTNHLDNLLKRTDVVVTAICDIDQNRIDIAQDHIVKAGQ